MSLCQAIILEYALQDSEMAKFLGTNGYAGCVRQFTLFAVIFLLFVPNGIVQAKTSFGAASKLAVPRLIVADIAPFKSLDAATSEKINFLALPDQATRDAATLAFAVKELQAHLKLLGINSANSSVHQSPEPGSIVLEIDRNVRLPAVAVREISFGSQAHRIDISNGSVRIVAKTGVGVLYGVYTYLEQLGFDWPDPKTTFVPLRTDARIALGKMTSSAWTPAQEFRGFWISEPARLDRHFLIWMARKKFNIGPSALPDLRKKLGIYSWGGGHHLIEEEFSRPGLFDRHPDWFARVRFLKRPVATKNSEFNPSFASVGAAVYFADRLAHRLEHGDLKAFDIVNVWQVDSFGRAFDEGWSAWWLGNESDNLLFFYGNVVDRLAQHMASGRVSRRVILAGASYMQTMDAPSNADNAKRLEGKAYMHLFYPIERDWSPLRQRPDASFNNDRIARQISNWRSQASLAYGFVDYHNMSRYGGLALSDFPNFASNSAVVSQGGLALSAYMHVALEDPGPRRLTHALAARLGWVRSPAFGKSSTIQAVSENVIRSFFANRFGDQAPGMHKVYFQVARATSNAGQIFGMDSLHMLLVQPLVWSQGFYSRKEVKEFVDGFSIGGRQWRPGKFYGSSNYRSNFVGIETSMELIGNAISLAQTEAKVASTQEIRANIVADIAWFKSTLLRYRAIYLLGQSLTEVKGSLRHEALTIQLIAILDELEVNPNLRGTVGDVDQTEFVEQYRKLAMSTH